MDFSKTNVHLKDLYFEWAEYLRRVSTQLRLMIIIINSESHFSV